MPQCIFCLQEKEGLTKEHVFPAALGGVLVVKDAVCAECNNGASKFEQPLIEELTPIRLLLRIPDRYGVVPRAAATLKTKDKEYEGRVTGDGKVEVKPVVTEIVGGDGKREFVHQFLTDRQKERLREEVRAKGLELIESGPGEPIEAEVHVGGDLMVIGFADGLRTAAKIAYTGLAFSAGSTFAMSDSFAGLRAYIKDGTGKPCRLFVHKRFMEAVQTGPHQHSIIIAGRNNQKRVDAIVRLFGGICYFVVLSENYGGVDFWNSLAYDAYRGEINGLLQSHLDAEIMEIEDVLYSKETLWEDLVASGRQFVEFLDSAVKRKLERRRVEVAAKNLEE